MKKYRVINRKFENQLFSSREAAEDAVAEYIKWGQEKGLITNETDRGIWDQIYQNIVPYYLCDCGKEIYEYGFCPECYHKQRFQVVNHFTGAVHAENLSFEEAEEECQKRYSEHHEMEAEGLAPGCCCITKVPMQCEWSVTRGMWII